ncbi:acyl-CoA thioesterase [Candidatus Omnitrophota bacterium]
MKKRIYYHHTDCGGVVYYAKYLEFLEEARTELLEERGIFVKELIKQGTLFVVARQEIDYKAPAFYGDLLQIETRIAGLGRAKIEFEYEIKNQSGKLISTAKTVFVFVDKDLKPKAVPEDVRQKIK